MIESEIAPVDEELQSLAHLVTRQHCIVLCCAHSVAELVEEVARNLRGLGFEVDVVCGAEARSALLGRSDRRDEPTIYVVCVQGTLKEQVLKPLRQALATHGGPNQHLFVAVLDLALPLAMVGQIRRFAEALERPAGKGGGINERRQWREHLGPNGSDRVPTRAYRAVDMLERTGTHPAIAGGPAPRTGPQTVIGSARPAKLGATAKYRAVTGQLPTVSEPDPAESGIRRRRKTHAPKVRVKPLAAPRGRRGRTGATEEVAVEPEATTSVATVHEPAEDPESGELRVPVPPADIDATMTASWGLDDLDTVVRPRLAVPPPPPVPARTGDTVIAAAASAPITPPALTLTFTPPAIKPAAAKDRVEPPTRRSDTVLYVESSPDEAVLVPTSEEPAASPTARGDTVIGQPPTRFRATPVPPAPRGHTLVGTFVPPPSTTSRDSATARGETVVAPAPARDEPASATARGETVVDTATARGDTVVAPAPARGDTVVARIALRGDTLVPTPAPARSETLVPTPSPARSETLVPTAAPARDTLVPTAAPAPTEILDAPATPQPIRGADAKSVAIVTDAPAPSSTDAALVLPRRSKLPLVLGGVGLAAAVAVAWSLGWFGGGGREPTEVARAPTETTAPATKTAAPTKTGRDATHSAVDAKVASLPQPPPEPATPTPATPTPATPPEPATPTPATPVEPATPTPVEPATPTPVEPATPSPTASTRIDPALADAVAERRLRLTEELYFTPTRGEATTWSAARSQCQALEIDGVGGFRLPHRRELRGLGVSGYLRAAPHWSRTSPDDDHDAVYVLHPSTGQLTVWAKQDSAAVACVRPR